MKKVTAIITVNGESKTVKVKLDDRTYALLMQANDQTLLEEYIAEEYKARNIMRKETRRHTSLEELAESGQDVEDERQDLFAAAVRDENKELLRKALQTLTQRQYEIVTAHVFEEQSFREIGDRLGIHKESVRIQYYDAIKKLKKFLEKHSVDG